VRRRMHTKTVTRIPTTLIRVRSNAGLGSMILPLLASRELPTIALASRPALIARVPQAAVNRVQPCASTTDCGHVVEGAD
jgi:hypothetical protein